MKKPNTKLAKLITARPLLTVLVLCCMAFLSFLAVRLTQTKLFATNSISRVATIPAADLQDYQPDVVTTDGSNNVYVKSGYADGNGVTILRKYNSSGALLATINLDNTSDVSGLAIDSNGYIYATTGNQSINKYASDGTFLAQWGEYGTGDGQFSSTTNIAVDSNSNVYVVDFGGGSGYPSRIQKFDSNGSYLTQWGTYGSGDGQFNSPNGIVVDTNGGVNTVYVADIFNNRIQKFDSNGNFISKWGSSGVGNGQFQYPVKLAIDTSSNVYVTDAFNARIQKFDSNGVYITKWGSAGSGDGQLGTYALGDIAVNTLGSVYYADTSNRRVQEFSNSGSFLQIMVEYPALAHPRSTAIGVGGRLYVADTENQRIMVYDSSGGYLFRWGSSGSGDGQFNNPYGIATDSSGNVYVADRNNNRVQKFDSNGNYLTQWGVFSDSQGGFKYPRGLAVDSHNRVYVLDTWYQNRIEVFDSNGTLLNVTDGSGFDFSTTVDASSEYTPQTIAIAADDTMYVTDTGASDIKVLSYTSHVSIDTASLSSGSYNSPYSDTILTSDAVAPVTFSVTSGTLPTGLSLDTATGEISGTPSDPAGGTSYFTVQVTDGDTQDTADLSIYIEPLPHLQITNTTLDEAYVESPYTDTIDVVYNYGTLYFSVSSGSLPPGVHLDPSTGELSGIPSQSGTYSFTITATYADAIPSGQNEYNTTTQDYQLLVHGPPDSDISVITSLESPLVIGNSAQYTVDVKNNGPEAFSYQGVYGIGSLILIPNELQYNGLTGFSDGITCAPYSLGDNYGMFDQYVSAGYTVLVCFYPTSTTGDLNVGSSIQLSFSVTATSSITHNTTVKAAAFQPGDPDYADILASSNGGGDMFALHNNSICNYSGINPGNCLSTLNITTSSLAGVVWQSAAPDYYSEQVSSTRDPYATYSITNGSLPEGLSMTSDGEISGYPTAPPGTYTFTVQAYENDVRQDSKVFSITVPNDPTPPDNPDEPTLQITTMTLSNGRVGVYYSDYLYVVDNHGAVHYDVVSGSLPAGLVIETSAGQLGHISGTPVATGSWAVTIRARDDTASVQRSYTITVGQNTTPAPPPTTLPGSSRPNTPSDNSDTQEQPSPLVPLPVQSGSAQATTNKSSFAVALTRVLRVFPWLLFIFLVLLAIVYLCQSILQFRYVRRAKRLLSHLERLTSEKKTFIDLASHYMRTPMTILKGGVELATPELPAEYSGLILGTLTQLDDKVSDVVEGIANDQALNGVGAPQQTTYQPTRFWYIRALLPMVGAIVLFGSAVLLRSRYESISHERTQYIMLGVLMLLLTGIIYLVATWYKNIAAEKLRIEELQRYQMSIDYARNQFILTASEQLRQPLNDLAQLVSQQEVSEALRHSSAQNMIVKALGDLWSTVEKFTLASQLQHNSLNLANPTTVTPSNIIAPIVDRLQRRRPTLKINQHLTDGQYQIKNPQLFSIALQNIMENAADYNISTQPIEVEQESSTDKFGLTVVDHGVGIEPERFSSLFKPFGRIEDAEEFTRQGMGMGLFLSRLIMDYLGGTITAQSTPGSGTAVSLTT